MLALADIQIEVEKVVTPVVEEIGLELIEVAVKQARGTYEIEVLIDRPAGGIGMEECVTANKKIVEVLDATQSWADNYELVVASPGLDRPLKNAKDFRRLLNAEVRVLLIEKVDGKGEYTGSVKDVGQDDVLIAVKGKDVRIPFVKIMKAVQNI